MNDVIFKFDKFEKDLDKLKRTIKTSMFLMVKYHLINYLIFG